MRMPRERALAVLAIAFLPSAEAFSCVASLFAGFTHRIAIPPPFSRVLPGASQLPLAARPRLAAARGDRAARSMALSDAGAQLQSLAADGDRGAVSHHPSPRPAQRRARI